MSEAHNHHFISQGYLRGFASGVGRKAQLFVFDLETRKSFSTLVRNVGGQRDFNRIDAHNHGPNALEEAYSRFEGPATEALKRVLESNTFEGEDKLQVINLIALFCTRHPRIRDQFRNLYSNLYRQIGSVLVADEQRYSRMIKRAQATGHLPKGDLPATFEQVRDFVERGEYDVVVHQNNLIDLEVEMVDPVLRTLVRRKWSLLNAAPDAPDFITSDDPVRLVPPLSHEGSLHPVGHATKGTSIFFPLSARTALLGRFDGRDGSQEVGRDHIAGINSQTILGAYRQIYAIDESFEYLMGNRRLSGSSLKTNPLRRDSRAPRV